MSRPPAAFDLEIGCDSLVIDPASWEVTKHIGISIWGHEWAWQKAMKEGSRQTARATMLDKRMTPAEIVGQLSDGMTLGIGGWGPRRKPMALVREILRSDLKDLTVVAYGGADVGMLCAAGKVRKLVFAFVSLDAIPLEPWFRKAREAGQIEVLELDEGMFQWGLKAASLRPALPADPRRPWHRSCRTGRAQDRAIALCGRRSADRHAGAEAGCRAAPRQPQRLARQHPGLRAGRLLRRMVRPRRCQNLCFSCEELVDRMEDHYPDQAQANVVERAFISGVTHLPGGAHPSSMPPRLMAGT
jgi:glutaconate CoA-transferase subunit A